MVTSLSWSIASTPRRLLIARIVWQRFMTVPGLESLMRRYEIGNGMVFAVASVPRVRPRTWIGNRREIASEMGRSVIPFGTWSGKTYLWKRGRRMSRPC